MITVPTQAESLNDSSSGPADCLTAQRALTRAAHELMNRLPLAAAEASDGLRLGASCMHFAGERALGSHSDSEQVRAWKECDLGERQIRRAVFQALRRGYIQNRDYDELFRLANQAQRARQRELNRLRRRLRQLAVV